MKSPSGRSADYASFLRALITSVKLLQEATQSTNLPIPNDPLAGVAVDHLEAIRVRLPSCSVSWIHISSHFSSLNALFLTSSIVY